eukprot:gene8101-1347_t
MSKVKLFHKSSSKGSTGEGDKQLPASSGGEHSLDDMGIGHPGIGQLGTGQPGMHKGSLEGGSVDLVPPDHTEVNQALHELHDLVPPDHTEVNQALHELQDSVPQDHTEVNQAMQELQAKVALLKRQHSSPDALDANTQGRASPSNLRSRFSSLQIFQSFKITSKSPKSPKPGQLSSPKPAQQSSPQPDKQINSRPHQPSNPQPDQPSNPQPGQQSCPQLQPLFPNKLSVISRSSSMTSELEDFADEHRASYARLTPKSTSTPQLGGLQSQVAANRSGTYMSVLLMDLAQASSSAQRQAQHTPNTSPAQSLIETNSPAVLHTDLSMVLQAPTILPRDPIPPDLTEVDFSHVSLSPNSIEPNAPTILPRDPISPDLTEFDFSHISFSPTSLQPNAPTILLEDSIPPDLAEDDFSQISLSPISIEPNAPNNVPGGLTSPDLTQPGVSQLSLSQLGGAESETSTCTHERRETEEPIDTPHHEEVPSAAQSGGGAASQTKACSYPLGAESETSASTHEGSETKEPIDTHHRKAVPSTAQSGGGAASQTKAYSYPLGAESETSASNHEGSETKEPIDTHHHKEVLSAAQSGWGAASQTKACSYPREEAESEAQADTLLMTSGLAGLLGLVGFDLDAIASQQGVSFSERRRTEDWTVEGIDVGDAEEHIRVSARKLACIEGQRTEDWKVQQSEVRVGEHVGVSAAADVVSTTVPIQSVTESSTAGVVVSATVPLQDVHVKHTITSHADVQGLVSKAHALLASIQALKAAKQSKPGTALKPLVSSDPQALSHPLNDASLPTAYAQPPSHPLIDAPLPTLDAQPLSPRNTQPFPELDAQQLHTPDAQSTPTPGALLPAELPPKSHPLNGDPHHTPSSQPLSAPGAKPLPAPYAEPSPKSRAQPLSAPGVQPLPAPYAEPSPISHAQPLTTPNAHTQPPSHFQQPQEAMSLSPPYEVAMSSSPPYEVVMSSSPPCEVAMSSGLYSSMEAFSRPLASSTPIYQTPPGNPTLDRFPSGHYSDAAESDNDAPDVQHGSNLSSLVLESGDDAPEAQNGSTPSCLESASDDDASEAQHGSTPSFLKSESDDDAPEAQNGSNPSSLDSADFVPTLFLFFHRQWWCPLPPPHPPTLPAKQQ